MRNVKKLALNFLPIQDLWLCFAAMTECCGQPIWHQQAKISTTYLPCYRCYSKHLPCDTTVRILYNIGCQTHRSCVKWGFLQEYQPRMSFTISVFHAFSHQWPCQIVYHPRKRTGFGLTDGEGCERFWSALKKLIPGLRVSRVSDLLPFVLCWILCLLVSPKNIYAGRPSQTSWQTVTSLTWSLALPALVPLPAQEAYRPFYAGFLWSPWSSPSDGVVKSIKGTDETCTM